MLQNYKVDKSAQAPKICLDLVKYIQRYTNKNKSIKNIVKDLNLISKVPEEILNQKVYQLIYYDFNFKKNKFEKYGLFYLIFDFFKYFLITFLNIFLHRYCHSQKKKL